MGSVSDQNGNVVQPRGGAREPGSPVLILDAVRKVYPGTKRNPGDVVALEDINLAVQAGEVIAIIGPSGCGKSTLLRCVNGLEEIQGGAVYLGGEEITAPQVRWPEVRQRIGMVFQSYELFPHLSVMDNLILAPRKVRGLSKEAAMKQARALLERVGLAGREKSYPRELSGGQKQRIAIVRALMMKPELLLLDEITASLDPEMVREVLDVVSELAREGMTMLLVTHELSFAKAVADRVVFMDGGRIVETGRAAEFFDAPQTPRARDFLSTLSFA